MKPGVPWSIKGVEPQAREAAKSQARKLGLTLGEWLNTMILGETPQQTAAGRSRLHVSVDTLIDRLARHEQHTAKAFGGINERLTGFNQRLGETVEKRIPRRPEDVPGFRALEAALRHAVDHMEANERRTRNTLAELDARLTALARHASGPGEDGGVTPQTPAGDGREIAALREEIGELSRQIEAARGDTASDHELEAVKATLAHISDRVDAMPDTTPIAEMDERLRELTRRLDRSLEQRDDTSRLDALAERVHGLETRLSAALAETAEEACRVAQDVAREVAEKTARQVLAERAEDTAVNTQALKALESGLAAVRRSAGDADQRTQETLEAVHATLEKIIDRLAALESRARAEDGLPEMVRNLRLPPMGEEPSDAEVAEPKPASAPPAPPAAEEKTAPSRPASAATATLRADPPLRSDDMQSVSRHDDFIAAARKAAQTTAQDPGRSRLRINPFARLRGRDRTAEPKDAAPGDARAENPGTGRGSLILAGAILLVLAASTYAVLSKRIDITSLVETVFTGEATPTAEKTDRASAGARPTPRSDPLTTGSVGRQSAVDAPREPKLESRPAMGPPRTAVATKAPETAPTPETPVTPEELPALPEALGPKGLRDAALSGDPAAQYLVATRYLEGKVVEKDFATAAKWYRKAAVQGLAPAQYRLATMFEKGRGVPQDLTAARDWYERAAEKGNAMAMHNLAVLYADAKPGDPALAKAADWFEKAAKLGLKDSQYNLGVLHERGIGVKRNPAQAYRWFSIAARQGDRDAEAQARTLEAQIEGDELAALKAEIDAWKPGKPKSEANLVIAPVGAWASSAEPEGEEAVQPVQDREAIAEAQALLNELGFSAGPADGVMGDDTANAVRLFQLKNGLEVNGTLTTGVLARLRSARG